MTGLLVDPPSQMITVAALTAVFADFYPDIEVSTDKPSEERARSLPRFVVISRIGGGRSNFATSAPRVLVECYSTQREFSAQTEAERLANLTTAALGHAAGGTYAGYEIRDWSDDENIARHRDPNFSHERFQFTGTLSIALQQ